MAARRVSFDEADGEVNDVYQMDFAFSIFATLLVYMLMLSNIAVSVSGSVVSEYQTVDLPLTDLPLKTYRPIYPFREFWVVRAGVLKRLDMVQIAARYIEKGPGRQVGLEADAVLMADALEQPVASEFRLNYQLLPANQGASALFALEPFHDREIRLADLIGPDGRPKRALDAVFRSPLSLSIIGPIDAEVHDLLAALHASHFAAEVGVYTSGAFVIDRHRGDFSTAEIYR